MKKYIGSGKKTKFGVNVTLDVEKCKEHVYEYNGKKYLTFEVNEKKEEDQYGKTHSVSIWIPDKENEDLKQNEKQSFNDEDIPF